VVTRIAFQGVPGAYAEEAVREYFGPEAEAVPCQTLDEVFRLVEEGKADRCMLAVENAVTGSVPRSYELLMERDLRICAEAILQAQLVLLGSKGTKLEDVERVRSHPQALAQCQGFLSRHGLRPVPALDPATSARDLAASPEDGVAVIAGKLAGEVYGLDAIQEGIGDIPFNYTRYFVLAMEEPPRAQRNKTSVLFTTPHQPGALYDCLGEFAKRRINLTKIESRPRLNRPWQYVFYLDFEGHSTDPECEAAMMGLLRRSSLVKLLGSYPAATIPVPEEDTGEG
jgi:prephenate dehydratase